MAVAEVLRALEAEASARFERIRQRAENEARALLKAAEDRRRPLEAEAMAKTRLALVAERARRMTRARFAVHREVTLAKEALIDRVFQEVRQGLEQVRRLPAYPAAFRALAREALQGVKGEVRVLVHDKDAELCREVLAELSVEAEIVPGLQTAGGLRIEVGDGRVVIDNTLEARLAKAEHCLRPEVNRLLFTG